MSGYIDLVAEIVTNSLEYLDNLLINKPMVSVAFPTSGLLSLFIPDNIMNNAIITNPVLEFIDSATPYLKFLFLILTLLLSVVSLILQVKKVTTKNKDKNE